MCVCVCSCKGPNMYEFSFLICPTYNLLDWRYSE